MSSNPGVASMYPPIFEINLHHYEKILDHRQLLYPPKYCQLKIRSLLVILNATLTNSHHKVGDLHP